MARYEPARKINSKATDSKALRAIPEREVGHAQLPANLNAPAYSDYWMDSIVRFSQSSIRSVMFTGTESGSGVTTSAAHFAQTLAQDSNQKILLLEANFRSPSLQEMFQLNGGVTIKSLVSRETGEEFVVPAMHDDLYIMPSGGRTDFPGGVFRTQAFRRLYNVALTNFDLVVIDAPPIAQCPESRFLVHLVDGVVLVVEADKTKKEVALFAKRQIEQQGGTIVGSVMNRTKHFVPEWIYRRV